MRQHLRPDKSLGNVGVANRMLKREGGCDCKWRAPSGGFCRAATKPARAERAARRWSRMRPPPLCAAQLLAARAVPPAGLPATSNRTQPKEHLCWLQQWWGRIREWRIPRRAWPATSGVLIIVKAGLGPVATIYEVVDGSGLFDAQWPWQRRADWFRLATTTNQQKPGPAVNSGAGVCIDY